MGKNPKRNKKCVYVCPHFFFAKKNGNKYKQGDNVQCTKMINNKIEERALKEVDRERE